MSGIVLSVVTAVVFMAGWNSANICLEYQKKVEDAKAQASKNAAVFNKARVLNRFPKGDE